MATHERQRRYQRRIPDSQRGVTFETRAAFESALRQWAEEEFVAARSRAALEAFRERFRELDAGFALEEKACRAVLALLKAYQEVLDLGGESEDSTASIPLRMVCGRVVAQFAPHLRALFDNKLVRVMRSEVTDPELSGDDDCWDFAPATWGTILTYATWSRRPEHRRVVFMALARCGLLGPRRDFRFLAVASLLAGGETVTFRPYATTVARAIEFESKRMREVALKADAQWATASTEPEWDEAEGPSEPAERGAA